LSTTEKGQQNGGGEGAPERRPDQPLLGPGGGLINRHLDRLPTKTEAPKVREPKVKEMTFVNNNFEQ
jgi:hypothetical protein